MKKFFYVLTIILSLSSCIYDRSSSRSSQTNSSTSGLNVVGEWVEYDANDPSSEDYLTNHFVFQAGGTGYWKLMGDLHSPNVERGRGYFHWTQNGNAITITESGGDEYVLAIHGNELVKTGGLLGVETYRKKR